MLLVSAAFIISIAVAGPEPCVNALPPWAQQALTLFDRNLGNGGLRVRLNSELSTDDQRSWGQSHPNTCAAVVSGHFLSPTSDDFFVLAKTGFRKSNLQLFLITRREGVASVNGIKDIPGNPVIHATRTKTFADVYTRKKTRVLNDAVIIEHLEASASALYLDPRGQAHEILISD
jgi:hypothetical protein